VSPSWILALRQGAAIEPGSERSLMIFTADSRTLLRQPPPAVQAALLQLAHPGEQERLLTESIRSAAGSAALAHWYYHLQQLAQSGWLQISAGTREERLATLVPTSASFVFTPTPRLSHRPFVLSRFSYLHRDGPHLVLESPLAFSRIVLQDSRAAALVNSLTRPTTVAELGEASLLGLLAAAGMVAEVGDDGKTDEEKNPALQCWEFHDLLFHARSRQGRHDAPIGATYRFAGMLEPPPALKPPSATKWIELFRPDLDRLRCSDPPLAEIQERRCSIREYGTEPIATRQLGEFLFRIARVKAQREWDVSTPAGPVRVQGTTRPYPAGGGLYELEVYVVVNACLGLEAGLYHYDPLIHRLARLAGRTTDVDTLLFDAARAAGIARGNLQVLFILSSRLPRLAWKYSSLAYALTLKHVGVVYQTMYLAATAMGLAPCALGGGDSDLFARAAQVDCTEETSVGEFLLGSKR
jgi:oxazoline/thiazoline dehydrogenase